MLSYRHAFHAGNHADVLKHVALMAALDYLRQKPASLFAIDTHAGGGMYRLDAREAQKLAEHETGIMRLWTATDPPTAVATYLAAVRELNPDGVLRHYPGSPWFFLRALRGNDQLWLYELHSSEQKILARNLSGKSDATCVKARVLHEDGLKALKALLPPLSRRAMVLIDPSYETPGEYTTVENALSEALQRFPHGVYAIWHPVIARIQARRFSARLIKLVGSIRPHNLTWLALTLNVRATRSKHGMTGSGLFFVNPPWKLEEQMRQALPWLAEQLGEAGAGSWEIRQGMAGQT